ncbi:hypothetical protein RB594_002222 [Gaeumannomyces avenae]
MAAPSGALSSLSLGGGETAVGPATLWQEQNDDNDERKFLLERWEIAVEEAKKHLRKPDFQLVSKFKSPEALMEDLKARQLKRGEDWTMKAISNITPIINLLGSSLSAFVVAMGPYTIEYAMVWGLAHLVVQLSLQTQERWNDFTKRLDDIRQQLRVLERSSKQDQPSTIELNDAMLEVFTNLIVFWAEAVDWMRGHDSQDFGTLTAKLNGAFDQAMRKVEASINRLKDAALRIPADTYARLTQQQETRHQELLDRIELSDVKILYPFNQLPKAARDNFHGREDVFLEMEEHLKGSHLTQRSVLLQGLGGVGKTETALNFAWRMTRKYDAVFWFRGESPSALKASAVKITKAMGFSGSLADNNEDHMILMLQNWFRNTDRSWLIIFDNVEDITDVNPSGGGTSFIPAKPGSIIITSRRSDAGLPDTTLVPLKPLSPKEGVALLRKSLTHQNMQLRSPQDERALTSFSINLGGLPLALRAVAGLMNMRKNIGAHDFHERFSKHSRKLLADKHIVKGIEYDRPGESSGHLLDQVWRASFQTIKDEDIGGWILISVLAFLCPDGISTELFDEKSELDAPVSSMAEVCGEDSFGLDEAICRLATVALIDYDAQELAIHRLVQDAFIHFCSPSDLQDAFSAAVHVVYQHFPHQVNGRPMHSEWEKCRVLIQHSQHLAQRFAATLKDKPSFVPPHNLAELLKSCAWYLFEMADHHEAMKMLDIAMSACPDRESELYAHLLNTKGCCSFELNQLGQCRSLWEEALEIRRSWAKGGATDAQEELANTLNNYGILESAEGGHDKALGFFDQAKAIRRGLGEGAVVPLGVSHMTTGRAYFLKGLPTEALFHYKLAEDIFLAKFGPEGHFMAHLNFAYGNLKLASHEHQEEMQFYTRAREILEKNSELHLLLAATLYKIACLEVIAGDRERALETLDKGLSIAEKQQADADVARIKVKKATLLKNGSEENKGDAAGLWKEVEKAMSKVSGNMLELEDNSEEDWDLWVCAYWR